MYQGTEVGKNTEEVGKHAHRQTWLKCRFAAKDERRPENLAEFVKDLVCQGEESEFYSIIISTTAEEGRGHPQICFSGDNFSCSEEWVLERGEQAVQ